MTEITTYEPDNSLKKGYPAVFKEVFIELRENRWLTYQLFKRDFFTLYKQSVVGILWMLIIPIVSVATFIILNKSGVFSTGDIAVPYPLYALVGIAFWQIFSSGLIASSNALVKAGSMLTQINFSKKSLVLASFGQSIVSFLIQSVLVAIMFIYYGITPSIMALATPLVIIPLILLTLGLGLILSILNGVVRDIANVLSLLMTFLMFLTPILYARPSTGLLSEITAYNPLYFLIDTARQLTLSGNFANPEAFFVAALLSFAVFVVCILVFHLTETRITERV